GSSAFDRRLDRRSRMKRECHVRFCESGGVRLPSATRLVLVVKGTRAHAQEVREACRAFLEGELKLTLNMAKTHITHVNDGFVFLGHRIIRKRGPRGSMRPVTTIPWAKYRGLARNLVYQLSGNYSVNKIDMVERLNRILAGWA